MPRDPAKFPLEPVLHTGSQHNTDAEVPEHSQDAQSWGILDGPSAESPHLYALSVVDSLATAWALDVFNTYLG